MRYLIIWLYGDGDRHEVFGPTKAATVRTARRLWETHSGLDGIAAFDLQHSEKPIYAAGVEIHS